MDERIDFEIGAPVGAGSTFPVKRFKFRGELFTTSPSMSGWLMMEIGEATDPACPTHKASRLTREFLTEVICEGDRDRFIGLLKSATPVVGAEELQELTIKLMQALGDGAPLGTSSSSSSMGQETDDGSGASFS